MGYKLWLHNMRTIEPLLPNLVNAILFSAKVFWKWWVFYFCNNWLNFYPCTYPFFYHLHQDPDSRLWSDDCNPAWDPEAVRKSMTGFMSQSGQNISTLPSGCWKQEFYCKGITSLTTCRSNMIIICFVKVRNVYHLFMQLRLRILIWEREWCTRSSTRMSQDIGIVCWYTCLQRGGMSLRNQIHSMLQQWHVCNTFHFLPNTLKYAENVSKKWQCWDSGNNWNFHTIPHIQELKLQGTKICDGVVLSQYSPK